MNAKALDIYNAPELEPLLSVDEMCTDDHHGRPNFDHLMRLSTETLNRHEHGSIPLHELKLKIGCQLMILRNYNLFNGMANGNQ